MALVLTTGSVRQELERTTVFSLFPKGSTYPKPQRAGNILFMRNEGLWAVRFPTGSMVWEDKEAHVSPLVGEAGQSYIILRRHERTRGHLQGFRMEVGETPNGRPSRVATMEISLQ